MPDEIIDLTDPPPLDLPADRRHVSVRTAIDHLTIELIRAVSVAAVALIGAGTARALIYIAAK